MKLKNKELTGVEACTVRFLLLLKEVKNVQNNDTK